MINKNEYCDIKGDLHSEKMPWKSLTINFGKPLATVTVEQKVNVLYKKTWL